MSAAFRTRRQIERYFGGKTIKCLICGKRFQKLASHLLHRHNMLADEYRQRFGLPWSRGLTSAQHHARIAEAWTDERRDKQRRATKSARIYELIDRKARRAMVPFIQRELLAMGRRRNFGSHFEKHVRALFDRGLRDSEIAEQLHVNRMTVNKRTRRWR